MADRKISELPNASVVSGTDQVAVVQSGITKRATVSTLLGAGVSLTSLTDVEITTTPSQAEILSYDTTAGSGGAWAPITLNLDALADVTVTTTPDEGDFLSYDTGSSAFIPRPLNLNQNSDVVITTTPASGELLSWDTTAGSGGAFVPAKVEQVYALAASDETTAFTTAATGLVTFILPKALTITDVIASLTSPSTSGGVTVDINAGTSTILSTKLTIDANEKTSTTAGTPYALNTTELAQYTEISVDLDAAGAGAAGLKIYLVGTNS